MIKKIINRLADNQRTIFLIDCMGALLTAFLLFLILGKFNEYFGMPKTVLICLLSITICFCMFSIACFLFLKGGFPTFIKTIGIANFLYCVLTTGFLVSYHSQLTTFCIFYFSLEIVIICGLGLIELGVASAIKNRIS